MSMEKAELRSRREALEELWRQGLSGRELLLRHTQVLDSFLQRCFAASTAASQGMALVAVGGYGRSELFPFSDIDLMLLYEPEEESKLDEVTSALFYPLWDAGLEVGHGVRTPAGCLDDAAKDFFFQVAMLDARLLAGSESLFKRVEEDFKQTFIEGRRQDFLTNMLTHRAKRHQDFGHDNYLLAPHIKESRGGLRDVQAMLWTARAVFGLRNLLDLENAGLLTSKEREEFEDAWSQLIRIRNRLHYLSGRKNDQLYFEHQEEMARAFEFKDGEGMLAVERFMREVYRCLQTVAVTTDLFFEHVEESLGMPVSSGLPKPLEPGIEIRNGRLHLTGNPAFGDKPALLMRIFSLAAKNDLLIHYRTRKIISAHLHLVDDKFRHSKRVSRLFLEVFQQEGEGESPFKAMLETGLLTAYLPEFGRIESLAQHDVYHVYTVDSHLLQTVVELNRLRQEEKSVFQLIKRPYLLFLAGLLHDIGKGSGSRHAERGAELAAVISGRLGLGAEESASLDFLIRNHLFLADTALRRDLDDENFIRRCASRIGDKERLAMLYLLSIADGRATGPTAWNDWKASLLLEVYIKIGEVLEHGAGGFWVEPGVSWSREKVKQLIGPAKPFDLRSLPDDYLLGFSPETVAAHIGYRSKLVSGEVLTVAEDRKTYWSLLIMTTDRPGLLSKICGVLALHNLHILAAQICTWGDGTVVDVLDVESAIGEEYDGQEWERLRLDLCQALSNRLGLGYRLSRKIRPAAVAFRRGGKRAPARVEIDNETSDCYTLIEVFAADRPGMLYDITRVLADFQLNIYRAKISKKVEQMVNVFYLHDSYGLKIDDPDLQEEIRQSLLHAVYVSD